MTLAQMIARLTRGYIKETGRQPVGLDKLRIKMEAAEKLRQMNKVVQFPQQRSFKQEIESMINDGTIKMGGVTKQSDKVRTRNMFKDSNLNKPKPVKTEAELKAEIEAGNKKSIQNLKDKIKDNPEDMADGGVAGLLGERTGFKGGGMDASKSDFGKSKSSKRGRTDAQSQYGATKGYQSSRNRSGRTTTTSGQGGGSGYTNTGGGGGGGPPGTNTGGGTTTTPTTTQPNFREIVRQKQILDYLNSLEEEDLALGIGPAPKVLGTIFKEGVKGVKPKIGKKGLGLEYLKEMDPYGNSLKFNLGTEYKDLLKGKLKPKLELKGTKGDLEYGFGMDKDKNINFGIKMPFGKQPRVAPRNFKNRLTPDISKFNFEDMTGIKSTVPANMQLAMITDTQKDLIDKQGKMGQLTGAFDPNATFNAAKMFDDKGSSGVFGIGAREAEPMTREEFDAYINEKGYADGGPARQNFKMGKRAFLKAMFGAGAGIAGLKSGLFGIGGKEATKKAVTETVKSAGSGTPPPYFFRLVEKIKFMGDDTLATQDKAIAKKYKDYVMEEDFAGNIEIIKKGADDMYPEDVYMSYKVDEVPTKIGKKRSAKVEEYEEFTARPDGDGKMKNIEPGVPDEVIDEAGDTTAMTLKKSSGGIARMLGE